jgi:hypothetical protein
MQINAQSNERLFTSLLTLFAAKIGVLESLLVAGSSYTHRWKSHLSYGRFVASTGMSLSIISNGSSQPIIAINRPGRM